MRKQFLICTTLVVAASLAPTVARAQTTELNFGVVSTEVSTNLKKVWDPYFEAMAKGTGLKINGFYASDYAGVIEGMRFNKVQVARYGNKSAMEAVNRSNGEVFALSVDVDGAAGYWSHLIVHRDSPLQNLDDVLKCDKSLNFGIGDPNSTSGFLVPVSYIFAARNIEPKTCFKALRAASHEANDMAVAHKQVDVATSNDKSLRRLQMTAPDARESIRVIWTSPLIKNDPLVWRKDLPADIKTRVYTWHMSYGRIGTPEEIAEARKVLAAMLRAPYDPTDDTQLLPIRILEANKDIMKLQADDKLSAEEKAAKISPLQAQIKKWQEQADKAEDSGFKKQVKAFLEADKAGNQAELKRMIAEFATEFAGAPKN